MEAEERPPLEHDAIAALAVEVGDAMKGHAGLFIYHAVACSRLSCVAHHSRPLSSAVSSARRLGPAGQRLGGVGLGNGRKQEGRGRRRREHKAHLDGCAATAHLSSHWMRRKEENKNTTTVACTLDFTRNVPLESQAEPPLVAFSLASPIILNRAGKQIRGRSPHFYQPQPPTHLTIASQLTKQANRRSCRSNRPMQEEGAAEQ